MNNMNSINILILIVQKKNTVQQYLIQFMVKLYCTAALVVALLIASHYRTGFVIQSRGCCTYCDSASVSSCFYFVARCVQHFLHLLTFVECCFTHAERFIPGVFFRCFAAID